MNISGDTSEKLLIEVEQIWQLDKIMHDLGDAGVKARVQRRPKEYASVVTGVGSESYKVYVSSDDFAVAQELIAHLQGPSGPKLVDEHHESSGTPDYFKRVIVHSILAVCILPLVFNWTATNNYMKLRKQDHISSTKKLTALTILLLGWIVSFITLAILAGSMELMRRILTGEIQLPIPQ